uniref:Uncharacterized protein n=1 Tax=Ananas comosus var. bracteatus TaxID=296719 RepID=A0A6V7PEX1_ANACO|nr:unnamed protein product [Ananas comosus var. bracteatus]
MHLDRSPQKKKKKSFHQKGPPPHPFHRSPLPLPIPSDPLQPDPLCHRSLCRLPIPSQPIPSDPSAPTPSSIPSPRPLPFRPLAERHRKPPRGHIEDRVRHSSEIETLLSVSSSSAYASASALQRWISNQVVLYKPGIQRLLDEIYNGKRVDEWVF